MRRYCLITGLFFGVALAGSAQKKSYTDSLAAFRSNYIQTHEVVRGKDRQFLRFFNPDARYKVICRFEKSNDSTVLPLKTSGSSIPIKQFVRFGTLHFRLMGKNVTLTVFQSPALSHTPAYRDYLFVAFTDSTTGISTYNAGRYIDLLTTDIRDGYCQLDFNKAYNPYCAYAAGYNCPLPPKENTLPLRLIAGEKNYAKPIH
jgi:uncharacterized protein